MKFLFLLFSFCMFLVFFPGCNKGGEGGGKTDVSQKSVEDLKKEVLSKAEACGEEIKKEYEEEIANNSKNKNFNENQLKKSLQKMRDNIKCK